MAGARLSRDKRLDRNWDMPSDTDSFGHRQPAALDAERALVGAALGSPNVIIEVGTHLEPEDFYITKHGDIWAAMMELSRRREPVDIITVREHLGDHPSVDSTLLADLLNGQYYAHNAQHYAERIKNAARRRRLIAAAGDISILGYEEPSSTAAEEKAKQIILQTLKSDASEDHIMTPTEQGHLLIDMLEARAGGKKSGTMTGFPALDDCTNGGLRGGELIVLAARTSVGKSSYAENVAEYAAKRQNNVLYFNLEMIPERMLERFAKRQHKLSLSAFMDGPTHEKDIAAMYEIAEERSKMPLTLVSNSMASTVNVWSVTNQHVMQHGPLQLIVVDYLQLLKDKPGKSGSEVHRIAGITSSLKALAMEHNCPLILISQLNREVEKRGGEPELHDLRDSGAIEQDADIVILMWRDDSDEVMMKVAKHRDGPTPYLPVHFDGPSFSFVETHVESHN